jgi:hypothetical protein
MQHGLRVLPFQGTAASPREMQEMTIRVLSHWLIDHLPPRALGELVTSLVEMFDFYGKELQAPAALATQTKQFARITRTTRPELVLPDEE